MDEFRAKILANDGGKQTQSQSSEKTGAEKSKKIGENDEKISNKMKGSQKSSQQQDQPEQKNSSGEVVENAVVATEMVSFDDGASSATSTGKKLVRRRRSSRQKTAAAQESVEDDQQQQQPKKVSKRKASLCNWMESFDAEQPAEGANKTSADSANSTKIPSETLESLRKDIAERNEAGPCRPKFVVKPRSRKSITAGKSLRLKVAISSNPPAVIAWDRSGISLDSGPKYSIYTDGEFCKCDLPFLNVVFN